MGKSKRLVNDKSKAEKIIQEREVVTKVIGKKIAILLNFVKYEKAAGFYRQQVTVVALAASSFQPCCILKIKFYKSIMQIKKNVSI